MVATVGTRTAHSQHGNLRNTRGPIHHLQGPFTGQTPPFSGISRRVTNDPAGWVEEGMAVCVGDVRGGAEVMPFK